MQTAVVIPTFNRSELLQRAIRSVVSQEKPPLEILIVNDGSAPLIIPPTTIPIKILKTNSEGPTLARMLAMDHLDPKVNAICYLDDDDELLPNHISSLEKPLNSGAAFAFSKATYKYPNGTQTEDPEPENHSHDKRYYDGEALLQQNIAPISSFMHTREAYTEIGGWDPLLIRMEDWDFWGRMFIRYGSPVFVDEITNVIYKGLGENRTNSNEYVYSMACSWRDIVADRLKHLKSRNRAKITYEDIKKFHIPKIGVVMPFYNAERYIRPAIESILAQTFDDFELIGINDGSTDKSGDIFYEYMSKDKRLRLFHSGNGSGNPVGVTKALNRGLLVSRSEYVARMDADDISEPDRFFLQVRYLDDHPDVMVCGSNFLSMNEDMSSIVWKNDVPLEPEDVAKRLLEYCCIGHPTVMMRRRVIEIVGGYDEAEQYKTVEDYELWLRISQKYKIANIPAYLLKYRSHPGQVGTRNAELQKTNSRKVRTQYRVLDVKHPDRKYDLETT